MTDTMKTCRGFSLLDYRTLLQAFLDKNYTFCGFSDLDPSARHVLLRHDVDFSTSAALTIAQIEAELGISAHYFILLRTEFYNIFSRSDYENILKIAHKKSQSCY